jgi:hypothetical protein
MRGPRSPFFIGGARLRAGLLPEAAAVPGRYRSLRLSADLVVNYESVVSKPSGEPDAQTVRFTVRQLW